MMIMRTSSIFAFLVLLMIESAVGQALVKPGCQESCGTVDIIPYPFGIGVGCYMNTWFEVSCNETSNPPITLLTRMDIEVLFFFLDPSIVVVKRRMIGDYSEIITVKPVNLSGSPFMSYQGEQVSFRLREYVPDVFSWLISEDYASHLPHRYPDAFRCFQPTNIISHSYALVFYDLYLVPNGTQLHNSSNGSRQCACEPGFQGNPYLPFGCKVKKTKILHKEKVKEFINEVVILTQINHRDIVKLLGHCLETEVPLLVYEFISNRTLFQYIHDQNEGFPLTWERRLTIAAEVASALSYLHSAVSIPIYHRDVKSSNILLDEKCRAIVSDFGTSRSIAIDQTHLTTNVKGAFGYLDSEYF
ncbi:hypothetical protein SLEP1_g36093 [Rubroshorea leprosula]|uniref:Protein kinase domain-containing protein n=1 Tax=Rubroshorea leprosula TaxID=152421 RepID=A0AAV5KQG6_9ROSI|nr:hypothetical protein SLEP1_g36093 [Rubroshorea leprosula]